MAQTSIHICPVKNGSEQHNERLKEMEHIRKDLSHLNQSWKSPDYPNINEQLAAIRADYQKSHGKKMHAKATPIREAVVVIQEGTTMQQLRSACNECYRRFGIQAMQIYTHLDEGYSHAKEWKPNRHAHIVFNWYDFGKHITCKLNKYDTMELQSIFALYLQMERGVSSDRKHLNAIQQKNAAEEKRLAEMEKTHEATIRQTCLNFQKIGKQTVKNFDWLQQSYFADTVPATKQERDTRDRLAEEIQRDLSEMQVKELMQQQSLLRNLIADTQDAITRIGKKLNKLATGISFWKKRRIAHEGKLQADKEAAELRAADAEKRAKLAIERAQVRESVADQREARIVEERRNLSQENERWQRERKLWLQKFHTIAKTLVTRYPKSIADFEVAGLRDAIGTDIWDNAKQPAIKQSRGPRH